MLCGNGQVWSGMLCGSGSGLMCGNGQVRVGVAMIRVGVNWDIFRQIKMC